MWIIPKEFLQENERTIMEQMGQLVNMRLEMLGCLLFSCWDPNKKHHKKPSEHIYTQWDETHLEDFPASFFDLHQ
jgi:hypothetical protein